MCPRRRAKLTLTVADFPDGYRIADPTDPFELDAGPFFRPTDEDLPPEFVLRAEARHCNAFGIVHGGLLMTLTDHAMCATSRTDMRDHSVATVSYNSEFLAPARAGELIVARAECLRRTGSFAFMRALVQADGRSVLSCSAVIKLLKPQS